MTEVNSEENKNVKTIEIINRTEENRGLARKAKKTHNDPKIKNSIYRLINQLSLDNKSPVKLTRKIKVLKNVFELR